LERPFEGDEVFEVVKALNGDKVPDPDGFNLMIMVWDCFDFNDNGLDLICVGLDLAQNKR
jgi:hypothetical protein